jgi:repressor LexA
MADPTSLTRRQREILDFISRRSETKGFPPTIRDIGTAFDIKSPNGVMCHLKALEKKGFISRQGKSARAIQVTHRSTVQHGIPFRGVVAAGQPIAAIEQDDRIELEEMFPGTDFYALKVRGQSMIDAHIEDGDIVIIKEQPEAPNGEKVVAMVDGDVTLKIIQRKKDSIHLIPANGNMAPIVVDASRDVRILGVLSGVIRKC